MRRYVAWVLAGLAGFLLVLAPLLRFVVAPAAEKAPLNPDATSVSEAKDATYLFLGDRTIRKGDLKAVRNIIGDVPAGDDRRAVWSVTVEVTEIESGAQISASNDRVALDRKTSEAIDCCGASINGAPEQHEGISYKFPFDVQKRTYRYFDTTLAAASDMRFVGEERVNGLGVYKFEQVIPPTPIAEVDVPGSLLGLSQPAVKATRVYGNTRTVWVHPRTGAIVKGEEKQRAELQHAASGERVVITEADLAFTPQTVKQLTDDAKSNARSLSMLSTVVPIVSAVLGLLVLALAAGLLRESATTSRRRRNDVKETRASELTR